MYEWVTHTHSHLRGRCGHACPYCYVQAMEKRFKTGRFQGPVRLDRDELLVPYGRQRVIFIEHLNDLFCVDVPGEWVAAILGHCREYPENRYILQSKNPERAAEWADQLPTNCAFGTTIETNRGTDGNAPGPSARASGMVRMREVAPTMELFVTVEPVLAFDPPALLHILRRVNPAFINIGADSKGHFLNEPSALDLRELVAGIRAAGIQIRVKRNLDRLVPPSSWEEGL